jgi:hypothetical protein
VKRGHKDTTVSVEQAIREIFQRTQRIDVDEDALADSIADLIPLGGRHSLTVEQVKDAVKAALREGVA